MKFNNVKIDDFVDIIKKENKIDTTLYEKYSVKRGLRNKNGTGVLVGLTSIGDVHGYIIDENEKVDVPGRLCYRGIDVNDIVSNCIKENRFGFEETAFLLLFGKLPNKNELTEFSNVLSQNRILPKNFIEDAILSFPSSNIMNKLARCVLTLYSQDPNPEDIGIANIFKQSISLISSFPTIVAQSYIAKEHYFGGKSLYIHAPVPEYSTAQNFLHLMRIDNKFTEKEAQILDLCLILHAEHGGGNNSAFTTHVVSSTGTDTYSAISAAICSLKGPKHGGANSKVMDMMADIKAHVSNWKDEGEVKDYIYKILTNDAFDRSGLVYGMGHAVYTISDPRAVLLKKSACELAEEKGVMDEFELYSLIEKLTPEVFNSVKGTNRSFSANVDFYSGFVYKMLGIPTELYTPIFAMSRIVGWCAHRLEEVMLGGKIIRPAYKSVSKQKPYTKLMERK